ncbi:YfgM family protein [Acinetobacter sp. c2-A9]|uniref:YfgM family protein n=1 Tax=Acinetobacter sp. c2-A9 TaxID=3342802 RepID=UPI0035BA6EC2
MVAMTDEEQKAQVKSFMQSYGVPIILGIVIALGGFFGWQWWQKNHHAGNTQATGQYQQVLAQADHASQDKAAYQKLKADAEAIIKANPNSVQALQAQLLLAKLAFDHQDFAQAETLLIQAQSKSVSDEGLKAVATLNLAYVQIEQKQWDKALQSLDSIKLEAFIPSVNEAKGDIFVAKNDTESAKKAYQTAWDKLIERKEPRELLQIKLAGLGVFVEIPKDISPVRTEESVPNTDAQMAALDAHDASAPQATQENQAASQPASTSK